MVAQLTEGCWTLFPASIVLVTVGSILTALCNRALKERVEDAELTAGIQRKKADTEEDDSGCCGREPCCSFARFAKRLPWFFDVELAPIRV